MALGFLLVAAVVVTKCVPLVSTAIYAPYIMEDACGGEPRTIQLPPTGPTSAIVIRSHQGAHYKSGVTCNFVVKTSNDYRIAVVFETLQFSATRGNCADSLLLSNAEDHTGPICNSAVKEVISNGSVMIVTWKTGNGAPASSNDGFKAIVTAYKPGTAFCTFSQFKCANQRCVADNFACDGHNNCGDNSDENCNFGRSFWHDWGSTVVLGVVVLALNVCAIGVLLHARRSSHPTEPEQPLTCVVQQPDGTLRNANAMPPTPYPAAGPAPDGSQPQPQTMRDFPGVTGIPVNLETGRQVRYQAPPAELANVDYPRSAPVNPIVMSMPNTSAPSLPDAFGEAQPNFTSAVPNEQQAPLPGLAGLQQPFRAANAQMPPRQRMPLFQHSHPPLSLYDQPDPLRPFGVFGMGGGPFGLSPFGGGPINLGGPMGMPFGGPVGPFSPRMPTFIIIETGDDDDDDSQLQDSLFMPDTRGGLPPSSASSLNQDPVFPTLLLQQRQQEREQQQRQRRAEEEERRGGRRRSKHRRHRRTAGNASLSTVVGDSGSQDVIQESKEEHKEAEKQERQEGKDSLRDPAATGAIAQPAPPPKPENKKDVDEDAAAPAAEKTVMRIDHIETLTTAAAALQKVGMFGHHISDPLGKECVAPDPLVMRRTKSQWDTPLQSNHEQNKVDRDQLPSVSTCDSDSVRSSSSTSDSETTTTTVTTTTATTTTETAEVCQGTTTQVQKFGEDSDLNYLRPTVALEDVTTLDNAQKRDRDIRQKGATKKR